MFEKLSPEYQVNKRLRSLLLHTATQHNISPATIRLLFKSTQSNVRAHVYDGGRHIKEIALSAIMEFFGQDYRESYADSIREYLRQLADGEQIEISTLHLVLCEANGSVGVYLYDGAKYRKKLSSMDLVIHFMQLGYE